MAFIEISDPKKRDEIVRDYINTKNQIKQKYENEKAIGLQQRIDFEKQYQPLIEATKDSTQKITTELKSNRSLAEKGYWKPSYAKSAIDFYLNSKTNIDKYYGIQKRAKKYVMGDSTVEIDKDSNIYVNNQRFKSSPGLWQLIMLNNPQDYTKEDAERYADLVEETQVIFNPLIKSEKDKPETTAKYTKILKELKESYETEEPEEVEEAEELEEDKPQLDESTGEGIKYLPGDKEGLLERLRLLFAEREAGNITSTTEEIVGVLDALLRMGEISRKKYNIVCKTLKC